MGLRLLRAKGGVVCRVVANLGLVGEAPEVVCMEEVTTGAVLKVPGKEEELGTGTRPVVLTEM